MNLTFLTALRFYNYLLKEKKKKDNFSRTKSHEKLYKKNFFKFAKSACNGTIDNATIAPTFTKDQADKYYPKTYGTPAEK